MKFVNSLFGRVVIALILGVDGFSIYLTLAVVFIAQATNTALSLHDLALILLVSLITSKGAHGIPGSAIVILAATLKAIPAIPVVGLVLILPIDWFVGIGRAVTNLIGNCVATVAIASWERDIDSVRARAVLDGEAMEEVNAVPGQNWPRPERSAFSVRICPRLPSFSSSSIKARFRGTIKERHRHGLTLDMIACAERPNARTLNANLTTAG
jgi:Sodium:dicarboxylate symporter family